MQQHDGLAGSGAAAQTERPAVVLLDVRPLLGVQEHPPCAEVAVLDDPTQLLAVLHVDVRELHAGCRVLERFDDLRVVISGGVDLDRLVESEALADQVQCLARGHRHEDFLLPRCVESLGVLEKSVLVRDLEGGVGDLRREPEVVGQVSDEVAQLCEQGLRDSRGRGSRRGHRCFGGLLGGDRIAQFEHAVDRVDVQRQLLGLLGALIVWPCSRVDVVRLALGRVDAEQHRTQVDVDAPGPCPRVGGAVDRLDVQARHGIALSELLDEGLDLRLHVVAVVRLLACGVCDQWHVTVLP